MTKCINFELSKRLNDLGLLDNIETEYCYNVDEDILPGFYAKEEYSQIVYKTLTLEEAIEVLNIKILYKKVNTFHSQYYNLVITGCGDTGYVVGYQYETEILKEFDGETLLEAIEKTIEYLISNNLLGKQ